LGGEDHEGVKDLVGSRTLVGRSVWAAASLSGGSIAQAWRCSRLSTSAVRGAPCADSQAIISARVSPRITCEARPIS